MATSRRSSRFSFEGPVSTRGEPGLRNLCEALRKRLNDVAHFNHANKPALLAVYGRILGIPSGNLVWTYLNKGTHEEVGLAFVTTLIVVRLFQILVQMAEEVVIGLLVPNLEIKVQCANGWESFQTHSSRKRRRVAL